jgi:two-component system, cell cycle sensor histidine kinase and response regulator CckA
VYGIVKQSGGYIWVYSEPELGTTFKLYFPVTHLTAGANPQVRDVGERPCGETILVVEDDEAIRANVCICLQHLGYKVLDAASGEDALELCDHVKGKVDLVLTDLVMPGMSGYDVALQLTRRYPKIEMVYTSGYSGDGATRRGLLKEEGVFLEKPYTVADLARAIQFGLNSRRRQTLAGSSGQKNPAAELSGAGC